MVTHSAAAAAALWRMSKKEQQKAHNGLFPKTCVSRFGSQLDVMKYGVSEQSCTAEKHSLLLIGSTY